MIICKQFCQQKKNWMKSDTDIENVDKTIDKENDRLGTEIFLKKGKLYSYDI